MPTYSYRCDDCGHRFDIDETISEHADGERICPECQSENVAWVPGAFYAKTAKKS